MQTVASASAWQKLKRVAAPTVAPALLACACYAIRGSDGDPSVVCIVLAVMPPFVAIAVGFTSFPRREFHRVVLAAVMCLAIYVLPVALWLGPLWPGSASSPALHVVSNVFRPILGLATVGALLVGASLVGSAVVCGVVRRARPWRANARAGRLARWLGAAIGLTAVVLMFWLSNVLDTMWAMTSYFLTLGAWLSAGCVVLILGSPSSPDSS